MKNKGEGGSGGKGRSGGGNEGGSSIEEEIMREAAGEEDEEEGTDDGAQDETDSEDDEDESGEGGDSDDDEGAEGEEADGDGGEDDGEGEEEEDDEESVDSGSELRELFLAQNQQIQQLVKSLNEKKDAPKGFSDEQWTALEEKTGMKKDGVRFIADQIIKPALKNVVDSLTGRLAKIESASAFSDMGRDPKFKDIGAYRGRMSKILDQFDPETRNNPAVMKMAYFAAKGMGAKKAVANEGARREANKKIATKRRPGAAGKGGSPDDKKGFGLSKVERQVARRFGLSDKEYAAMRKGKKKGFK